MKLRATLLALVLVIAAFPAWAVVMEKPGDPSLTVDTDSGLEWLDLTATAGRSYDDVAGDILLSSFRHATRDEVRTLYVNAGFVFPTPTATLTGAANATNAPAAELLLDLMGCTKFCDGATKSGVGFADWNGAWKVRPNYTLSPFGGSAAVQSLATTNTADPDPFGAGHYLVRETTGATATPEPSAAALFAVGSLIVASVTRRRGAR